jgi:hypothetical protein
VSGHLVLDVPPAERAEHLSRLKLEALSHLAAAVELRSTSRASSPSSGFRPAPKTTAEYSPTCARKPAQLSARPSTAKLGR